jgi:hypothetical protein
MKEGARFGELDGKLSPGVNSTTAGLKRKGAGAHDSSNEKSLKKTPSFMLDETFQSLTKGNLSQNQNKHDTLTYGPLTQSKNLVPKELIRNIDLLQYYYQISHLNIRVFVNFFESLPREVKK